MEKSRENRTTRSVFPGLLSSGAVAAVLGRCRRRAPPCLTCICRLCNCDMPRRVKKGSS
jgi:hypothetical protein